MNKLFLNVEIQFSESVFLISYIILYLGILFFVPSVYPANWIIFFFLPILIILGYEKIIYRDYSVGIFLASVGIRKYNLFNGIVISSVFGLITGGFFFGVIISSEIVKIILNGLMPVLLIPLSLIFILMTSSLTEELFFRGLILSRLTRIITKKNYPIVISAFLSGAYHLLLAKHNFGIYYYSNEFIDFYGAFIFGVILGFVSGAIYIYHNENIIASILYNTFSVMPVTVTYLYKNYL